MKNRDRKEKVEEDIGEFEGGKGDGVDNVPKEMWKYGGQELEDWVRKLVNRIRKGEGWPDEWKEGVIVAIVKKGQGEVVEEYRRVSLMPSV